MFAVTVSFEIKEGQMAAFLTEMRAHAAASRQEPACRKFDICTDPERPGEVFLYELYDDRAGFDAHNSGPRIGPLGETLAPMIEMRDLRTYDSVES